MSPRVILASQSPRRQELLKHIYKVFEIVPSFADEDIDEKDPGLYVEKLSRLKAREVYDRVQDEEDMVPEVTGMKRLSKLFKSSGAAATDDLLVIGADTIVVRDGEILGKPKDEAAPEDAPAEEPAAAEPVVEETEAPVSLLPDMSLIATSYSPKDAAKPKAARKPAKKPPATLEGQITFQF